MVKTANRVSSPLQQGGGCILQLPLRPSPPKQDPHRKTTNVNQPPAVTPHVDKLQRFKAAQFWKSPLCLLRHPFIDAADAHCFNDEANPFT